MEITCIRDIRGENINWMALGERFQNFREARNMSQQEAGDQLSITAAGIVSFESGFYGDRKSINIIWNISFKWNLSVNWLLNGIGKPHDADPIKLMPETLIIQKGSGIRRSFDRVEAEEGNYSDLALEFVMAIDKFKIKNGYPFPSWTQIFEIITALGYRKSVPARIAPLGYIIKHQEWAEKLKHMNEAIEKTTDLRDKDYRKKIANTTPEPISQFAPGVPRSFLVAQDPTAFINTKAILPSKVLYIKSKKKRKRQAAILSIPTPSKAKKQRRVKIVKCTHMKGKKFLLTDRESRQYIVENLPQFCRDNKLTPSNMYSVASGKRKQHKGWRAEVVSVKLEPMLDLEPKVESVVEICILDRIRSGLIS